MNGAQKFFQPVSGGSWNSHGRKAIFAILDDSTALMPALVMAFVLILTVVICSTRIYSGLYLTSRDAGKGGARTVGMLPYWIPFLGHIVTLSKGPDKLIQKIRYVEQRVPISRDSESNFSTEIDQVRGCLL